jgi:hypothetical protein
MKIQPWIGVGSDYGEIAILPCLILMRPYKMNETTKGCFLTVGWLFWWLDFHVHVTAESGA